MIIATDENLKAENGKAEKIGVDPLRGHSDSDPI
jgi:hypothetical protein